MKKLLSIITIAALALSLTACGKPAEQKKSELYSGGRGLYFDGTSEGLQSLYEQALAELPDKMPLPDGTTADKNETAGFSLDYGCAYFDFAYIRYAEPIFEVTTSDDPNKLPKLESPEWIKVKAGDVLENGLKVVSAQTPCRVYDGTVSLGHGEVKLEGEITLEGYFNYFHGSGSYGFGDYRYGFYPDTGKHRIPILYSSTYSEQNDQPSLHHLEDNDNKLIYDGSGFDIFRFEDKALLDQNFDHSFSCKAKLTYKNIVISNGLMGEVIGAELDL